MNLSKRLSLLAGFHHQEENIWDIGCDHGFLGLSFLTNPIVKEIHLVDPSEPVIKLLQNKTDSYITRKALFIQHKTGQEITLNPCSNLIFIAGMGGKEIQQILTSLLDQKLSATRFVISPHRNILELRSYLNTAKCCLESETLVYEGGRYYQVMTLCLDQKFAPVSLYGEAIWKGSLSSDYRDQQILHFQDHRDGQSRSYCLYLQSLKV